MKEKIYLTKEGYDKYLAELENMRKELANKLNNLSKLEMLSGESFYTLTINIKHKLDGLKRIVILDEVEQDIINVNDIVTVNMIYPETEETITFELVAGMPDLDSGIMKISVNSPLGKAVYQRKIGEELSYIVDNAKVNIQIISKTKPKTLKLD
jgi:transcription elongation GreA/GreB family factor